MQYRRSSDLVLLSLLSVIRLRGWSSNHYWKTSLTLIPDFILHKMSFYYQKVSFILIDFKNQSSISI